MRKVEDFVPKDKYDCSGIDELRNLSDEETNIAAGDIILENGLN